MAKLCDVRATAGPHQSAVLFIQPLHHRVKRSLEEMGVDTQDDHLRCHRVVLPEGDHRLLDVKTGEFVPEYRDLIADWAVRRVPGP
ncbi:MAG: hypothetical protein ACRDZM_18855 [Acidimicrobiia bacterium]